MVAIGQYARACGERARLIDPRIMADLHEPLAELGRRWACSPHRLRPSHEALADWDAVLALWLESDLPLILRDSGRREETALSPDGRAILFGDNTPANWSLSMALDGRAPDLSGWTAETVQREVPLSFTNRGGFKRDLNRAGWKVCHIEPVSDRKRYKAELGDPADLAARFLRFMSPRNMFVVPKAISGAGELPEVIAAVANFERQQGSLRHTSEAPVATALFDDGEAGALEDA
jgi:hypothetical protein